MRRFAAATGVAAFFSVVWAVWGSVLALDYVVGGFWGWRLNLDFEFDGLKWRERYKLSPKTLKYNLFAPWEVGLPFLSTGAMIVWPSFGTVLAVQLTGLAAVLSMAATITRAGMSAQKWARTRAGRNHAGEQADQLF